MMNKMQNAFQIRIHPTRSIAIMIASIAILLLIAIPVSADMSSSPWAAEQMWCNGTLWQMIAPPGNVANANANAQESLYIVAPQTATPQAPATNDHLPGVAHDHVISCPAQNHGSFGAVWHVYVVLCTPSAISGKTCTPILETFPGPGGPGTGPTLPLAKLVNGLPLESDSAVQNAINGGYAHLVDTGIVFNCPVQRVR